MTSVMDVSNKFGFTSIGFQNSFITFPTINFINCNQEKDKKDLFINYF
jgi:hypothetical protein